MWNFEPVVCVHCNKEIVGCCYPAYQGTVKIGYRHTTCPEEKPFGNVTEVDGEELD